MIAAFDPGIVKAILFDLDGTLANTDDAYVDRLAHKIRFLVGDQQAKTIARRMIMLAETPTNAMLGLLDRLSLDDLLRPTFDALHRFRGEARSQTIQLIPDIHTTLQQLATRFPLALVTARDEPSTLAILKTTGIAACFSCIASARTCRRNKPHPAPVLWAANQLAVSPEECLMVGDTSVDMRAGIAAGAQTAGVLCGFGERAELLHTGAQCILESPASLVDMLMHKATPK